MILRWGGHVPGREGDEKRETSQAGLHGEELVTLMAIFFMLSVNGIVTISPK